MIVDTRLGTQIAGSTVSVRGAGLEDVVARRLAATRARAAPRHLSGTLARYTLCRMIDDSMLRDLVAAFNAHDLDRIMSFFTEDCVLETPRGSEAWGTRYAGRSAVREGLASRFAGIPDVHYGDDEHWICGEHAVSKWALSGTTAEGQRVQVRGCDLFDLAPDGLIRRKDSYWKIVT